MPRTPRPRSPLSMVVLALACEEPMHPYRMQALLKERGKDQVVNVAQRNSVYQAIAALRRAGLIAVRETSRAERRPERTVYEATEAGRRTLREWLRGALSTPARMFPDFPAALSLICLLAPDDARERIEARLRAVEARLAELEAPVPGLPRVFLLEAEYMAAVARAEAKWLRGVAADLASGRLTWSAAWLKRMAAEMAAPSAPEAPRASRRRRPS